MAANLNNSAGRLHAIFSKVAVIALNSPNKPGGEIWAEALGVDCEDSASIFDYLKMLNIA